MAETTVLQLMDIIEQNPSINNYQSRWRELRELLEKQALNASQQTLAPDVAYWLCKNCGAHQYKDFDTCGDCNTPRG